MELKKYAVVLEWSGENFAAYCPDIPGCIAVGDTHDECLSLMQEALQQHIDWMRSDGDAVPEPSARVATVDITCLAAEVAA